MTKVFYQIKILLLVCIASFLGSCEQEEFESFQAEEEFENIQTNELGQPLPQSISIVELQDDQIVNPDEKTASSETAEWRSSSDFSRVFRRNGNSVTLGDLDGPFPNSSYTILIDDPNRDPNFIHIYSDTNRAINIALPIFNNSGDHSPFYSRNTDISNSYTPSFEVRYINCSTNIAPPTITSTNSASEVYQTFLDGGPINVTVFATGQTPIVVDDYISFLDRNGFEYSDDCTATNDLIITQSPPAGSLVSSLVSVFEVIVEVNDTSGNSTQIKFIVRRF